MVFGEEHSRGRPVEPEGREFPADEIFLEQLFANPERHRHREAAIPARRESEIGLDEALEFQERLFVEDDCVDSSRLCPGVLEAEANRVRGKTGVMLATREALLLGGGGDPAIDD